MPTNISSRFGDWRIEKTDNGFTIEPDLTKIPVGKMDTPVMIWVIAAWDKLNRENMGK